jgi:ABC-type amino acid transport substrate-binding protein
METKMNQPFPQKRRLRLRPGWQDRLPIRPVLLIAGFALLLTLLILVNRPRSRVLNSAEMEMVKSAGVLRIGVDESLYGLSENGSGMEYAIGNEIGETIFESADSITFVPCTRYSALWRMDDGYIDLAIMAMQSFDNVNYERSELPFYIDDCVLMAYSERPLGGASIGVLSGTPAETLLYRLVDEQDAEVLVVPCADYYSMLVKLRAGTVDALCMPRTAAKSHLERGMLLYQEPLGTISYYAIAPKGSVLLDLCDELFETWAADGTLAAWRDTYGL